MFVFEWVCYIKTNIFCRGYHIHVQRIGLHIMVLKLVYIECKLGWITKLIAVKVYNC